jgi:hypothetical protein
MLDISFEDEIAIGQNLPEEKMIITCDTCSNEALIFQEEGNFCLECWQERTEPCITIRNNTEPGSLFLARYPSSY